MTPPLRLAAEPARSAAGAHPIPPPELGPAFELAREWAGPARIALLLGGSFACDEAVWMAGPAGRVALSDVDLYAVVPDRAAQRRARERRVRAGAATVPAIAGPIEVAFLTEAELRALPARPATLQLRRRGRVIEGDPGALARIPDWRPADVSVEERLLLAENRACELLAQRGARGELERCARDHAQAKCALDLGLLDALEAGAWPEDAAACARHARERALDPEDDAPPYEWARAWRQGDPRPPAGDDPEGRIARGLLRRWTRLVAPDRPGADPLDLVARGARRAPLPRRLRRALDFRARAGLGPPLGARLRFALAGAPQHRLGASAIAILAALALPSSSAGAAAATLRALGVVAEPDPERAAAALAARWRDWITGGGRA